MAPELKRKLDYSDLAVTPDDGKRYEIIEGDLYVTPSPSPVHQRVSARLFIRLMEYFDRRGIGEVFYAPVDLILSDHDIFVPDLLVVADAELVSKRGIEGPPLLVVEILSPGTKRQDRGLKARRYAELGIRHYWIVDPEARKLECHRLAGMEFLPLVEAEGSATLVHPDWQGLEIDLAVLWS